MMIAVVRSADGAKGPCGNEIGMAATSGTSPSFCFLFFHFLSFLGVCVKEERTHTQLRDEEEKEDDVWN